MKRPHVFLALIVVSILISGCQSHSKHHEKEGPVVPKCSKPAEPGDTTLLVIQWKRHTSHASFHDLAYFTFHYTPHSDEPCSYETVGAMICERYVTSYESSPINCRLGGKQEPVTKIVVNAEKIVHIGASPPFPKDTSDCFCPKP